MYTGLPTKAEFVQNIFMEYLTECVIRRDICPLAHREDHERYCYAKEHPMRIIDLTECPIKLSRRLLNGNQ